MSEKFTSLPSVVQFEHDVDGVGVLETLTQML